ncbi:helix-turn-helix domain-containing protein [Pelagibius marinus]|uniref:helix-turn-helix domain-containing protein n=1 Tax=Pelagibius marinus TaxID=2762760 RepID=UPI001872D64F|nr:helix-turn-helix domain-containing protein [Pelagibius marinus]
MIPTWARIPEELSFPGNFAYFGALQRLRRRGRKGDFGQIPGQIEHKATWAGEAGIPNFALYGEAPGRQGGEAGQAPFPDVLHCESIPARASLHDWTIAPHRHHNLHQFFWIEPPKENAEGGEATLEGRSHALAPAAAISLPPLSVHGFQFRPGTQGWVVTLPVATLAQQLADAAPLRAALARTALIRPPLIHREQSPAWIFEAVAREFAGSGLGRDKALASLVGLLATWFARALAQEAAREAARDGAAPQAGAELLARFQALVEQDYRSARALADYARALGVTPTHLSRVSRALTGVPASQLVLERRLLEARRALAYTTMQVAEIAYMLGYSDPAYFARVFAKATGESPSAFRVRMTAL